MSSTASALLNKHLVEKAKTSTRTISEAFAHYGCLCPSELAELYREFPGGFVTRGPGETMLFFSPDQLVEVVEALTDIDIAGTGIIPLADLKDNTFFSYSPMRKLYLLYNSIDQTEFDENKDLDKALEVLFQ